MSFGRLSPSRGPEAPDAHEGMVAQRGLAATNEDLTTEVTEAHKGSSQWSLCEFFSLQAEEKLNMGTTESTARRSRDQKPISDCRFQNACARDVAGSKAGRGLSAPNHRKQGLRTNARLNRGIVDNY
jgi:hypothetical protein